MTEQSIRRLSVSRRTLLSRAEANETPDGEGFRRRCSLLRAVIYFGNAEDKPMRENNDARVA